ncbi:LysR family transcriptional regulator [Streptomyces zhihengii]
MTEWDIRKLRILRTLDERGTVTAAAETLRMTPSAVSQQLSNLSRQLGVPLLEADGGGCGSPAPRGWCCATRRRSSPSSNARTPSWPAICGARRARCGWRPSRPR